MITKLVYVLTCAPDKHYIEQALMAVWSARHRNPESHIVLLVDDKTDRLLTGKRAEILQYVSEKKVVSFDDDSTSPMYRSRWIKTSVRNLVDGDFMFVDCDTIVCRSLCEIDSFKCEVGAVWESHLLVADFCESLTKKAVSECQRLCIDLIAEKEYFSSGMLFVKDSPRAHELFEKWHSCWLESNSIGLPIDQPSLAKANAEMGHVIEKIPDTYNCIVFTKNTFVREAHILHITAYENPSYLFTGKMLDYVSHNGLQDWIKDALENPCNTMLPFDYSVKHSTFKERREWIKGIAATAKRLKTFFPDMLSDFPMKTKLRNTVVWCFDKKFYKTGALVWMGWRRAKLLKHKDLKDNVCRK